MTTAAGLARPPVRHPAWVGDPAILVFATRYALTVHGFHVPEFVAQAVTANAITLSPGARRAIVRDVRTWLDGEHGATAKADERARWIAVLAALGAEA